MPDSQELDRIILSLLFASDEPLSPKRISQILEVPKPDIIGSLERLTELLEGDRFVAVVESVGGGYQLATRPEFSKYIARLYSGKRKQRLSKAGLETLAIIAYKQPITRAEIENIRGVSCGGVITTLMERSLIRISGKAKVLGSPFLYATTQEFLEYLGLNSLKDLPDLEELEALLEKEEYREEAANGGLSEQVSAQIGGLPGFGADLEVDEAAEAAAAEAAELLISAGAGKPDPAGDAELDSVLEADQADIETTDTGAVPQELEMPEPLANTPDDEEDKKITGPGDIPTPSGSDPEHPDESTP
jgi:segregation and condensation protein B